ncbi:MAG: hypothetical protein OXG13_00095 [Gemmatimonadaceae bacterium]|nr:hypothetical protein [Gemmatimonadaceae bacterium]
MKAGEIDVRMQAGARVTVVHGRGERHPVSGKWARLDSSMGHVQAVDDSALILAREGNLSQQRVPLDRIHRLVMEMPSGASGEGRPRPAPVSVEVRREDRGARVFRKLGGGVLGGVVWGLGGMVAGAALGSSESCPGGDEGDLCGLGRVAGALLFGTTGYTVGAAAGVSRVDPHDRFIPVLGGSAAGLVAGFYLTGAAEILWPTLFAGPVAVATMVSEWSREPPEAQRISIALQPHPGGGMSTAATLRF